jgi:predicted amidophosphoribosyltransferase
MISDPEQVRRSKASVAKVVREKPASWLKGEVRRHCVRCEAEVGREDHACPVCAAPLRKKCPRCHYWVEIVTSTCPSCRYFFPPPALKTATVKLWHEK